MTAESPKITVIIPSYNEEERLPVFLDHVLEFCKSFDGGTEVLVVNDGSTDGTSKVVTDRCPEHPNLRLVEQPKNMGKGAAVRRGMLEGNGQWRLFADADGATQMDELASLIEAVENGAEIAIASREGGEKQVECSPLRRFLGRWFNRAVRMGSVKGIRDTQCGFKLFASEPALKLFEIAREDGFAFDVELLYLAQKRGIKVFEVPVNWTEIPGSKVSLVKDGWRMLKAVKRIKRAFRQGDYDSERSQ
ncbi:MAG: glycosyltransferase family 2 protein [Planctomycetes bacterium]|nr:glycosyltransferase family 2 protein [Planctomycetota bacterium]